MTFVTSYIRLLLPVFLVVLLFSACKKDNNVLGVNTQPSGDELNAGFSDAGRVVCFTKNYDSIASFRNRYKFLGSNLDPYLGKMDIGLYLNANLPVSDLTFSASAYLTSAELIFAIDNFDYSGDPGATLNYSLYPLDSSLNANRIYYTSNKRLHASTPLNTGTTYTTVLNKTPVIRIKIDSIFASKLFKDNAALASNTAFLAKYKGFYIQCQTQNNGEGVIFKCDLENDLSGLYLRYKAGVSAADTVQSYRFLFSGSSSAKYNTLGYDYKVGHTNLISQLQGDTTAGAENLYLKGMGATRIKVHLPDLKSYADSFKVAVNRAELVFNVDQVKEFPASYNKYTVPTKLSLIALDSLGREIKVKDQLTATDLGRYDGGYDSDNKRYVFNIARHVQAILNGQYKNYGFHLVVADPSSPGFRDDFIGRVILLGSNGGDLRPKLNLSFIKFRKD